MVTWFNWGEYAIWHFSPRMLVSIDGRRETVYSESVRTKHLGFFFDVPAYRKYASELKADYIWLPIQLPIVASLTQEGWARIFLGSRSILFARPGTAPVAGTASGDAVQSAAACFPGP